MSKPQTFQDLILTLVAYWSERGCAFLQGYDLEVGAGTMNPATFLRVLGPEPWSCVYVEPSRRPADGRYGENPNRLHQHHQLQVILKPAPDERATEEEASPTTGGGRRAGASIDVQELYLGSLAAIGLTSKDHDLRFVEDDWESPTLNAWGLGWEVWCDGMEVTQFTYFQQAGGHEIRPVAAELTYGLERIAMYLQQKDNVYDLAYAPGVTYGDVWRQAEREFSFYSFKASDPELLFRQFAEYERECRRLIAFDPPLPLPAFDMCLKCSHAFNLLDARGAISVTERAAYIGRVRALAKLCADGYLRSRAELGFPRLADRVRAAAEAKKFLELLEKVA